MKRGTMVLGLTTNRKTLMKCTAPDCSAEMLLVLACGAELQPRLSRPPHHLFTYSGSEESAKWWKNRIPIARSH
jgi:hypothetical protein